LNISNLMGSEIILLQIIVIKMYINLSFFILILNKTDLLKFKI